IISVYTRADALRDGVLVEIPLNLSIEAGIKISVALTSEAWHYIDPGDLGELSGQSINGRLWDLLNVFRVTASQARHTDRIYFNVAFLMPGVSQWDKTIQCPVEHEEVVTFKAICGPGDDMKPVITIMLPWED
ncbi:MAG TPA: DUF6573 family protein, partial [Methanoregulaceae archaeon]|nr:DUF6573 family protein [Methanoregulaceae archaeon]